MPKAGPLWSSTMTSWIIVSSRCVFGSSNGMRQFSARSDDEQADEDQHERRARALPLAAEPWCRASSTSESEPERFTSTSSPRKSAGSARQENVASRAPPMPSNAEPVSSAAATMKKRASAEQVREEHEIAGERERRARGCRAERAATRGAPSRCRRRGWPEDPGRRRAEDRALSKELRDVVVRLEDRRADAPGEERLRLVDHAEQQRRQHEDHEDVNERVDGERGIIDSPRKKSTVTISVAST